LIDRVPDCGRNAQSKTGRLLELEVRGALDRLVLVDVLADGLVLVRA